MEENQVLETRIPCIHIQGLTVRLLFVTTVFSSFSKAGLCIFLFTILLYVLFHHILSNIPLHLPRGSDSKESADSAADLGLILGLGRSLGEEMAMHSSILAWRIPWPESMGLQTVRYD